MNNRLYLLRLYVEWGADESLSSLCTNHFENVKPTTFLSEIKTDTSSPSPQSHPLQAHNLEEICQAIQTFKGCALHDTAMYSIMPKGNPDAPIFIIGEVPDADEDRSGQVFFGQSEFWLRQMLASINVALNDCFCMPIIPWRPPGGRQVSAIEFDACLPFLYKVLEIYKPKFILSIGLLPAQILTQIQSPMSQLKSKWHTIKLPNTEVELKLFPLRSPSQINASPKVRKETWQDLLQIRLAISQKI